VKLLLLAAMACVLAAAGCSTNDPNSAASPAAVLASAPPTPLVTDTFTGTVQQGSSDSHPFTVTSNNFQAALALTDAGPPATIAEGFGVGQPVGGTCQLLSGGFGTYSASTTP
jgi:hypothetical protein